MCSDDAHRTMFLGCCQHVKRFEQRQMLLAVDDIIVKKEQICEFAKQYLPFEGIKIYTEIKDESSGMTDGESILNEVSAVTYIFMDEALCSDQYETFLEAMPNWLKENCQGVPVGIYLRMTESKAWEQIDRANYEDKLREDIYTEKTECTISESGKVAIY